MDPGGGARSHHGDDPGGYRRVQTGNLIGAALGLNLLLGLPAAALALGVGGLAAGVLMTGTYQTIQNTLVGLVGLMGLVFCAVAVLTAPDLGDLIAGILIPRLPPGSLLTVLALIGTTFVSYNLFLHANTAAVADQLTPLLGRAAPVFFGLGLFAAGLTSAITAPLAAAYAASGALGWRPDPS